MAPMSRARLAGTTLAVVLFLGGTANCGASLTVPLDDGGRSSDGGRDAVLSAPDSQAGETILHLVGGETVHGALTSIYDHSAFWDASTRTTYGIFDEARFHPYPQDESVRFFGSQEIASIENLRAAPSPVFVDFLRRQGIVLKRPPLDGVSFVIEGNEGYHLQEDGYGNFAWDLVKTFEDGSRFKNAGAENADYATWNEPVYLPTDGIVIELVRDAPDNRPGSYPKDAVNNMIGVYLGGHYYVYILHFRQGSIPAEISIGTHLSEGAYLGRVGNSGVTLEPHVHTTLLYYTLDVAEPRTWSIPGEFANVYVADTANGPGLKKAYAVPATGAYISRTPF